jgi:hypothetical protein
MALYFFVTKQYINGETKPRPLIEKTFDHIVLPESIDSIYRIEYNNFSRKLLIVAKQVDGSYGLWNYDTELGFEQIFHAEGNFSDAHVFVFDDGSIYYNMGNPAHLYRSADSGVSWQLVTENIGIFWSMAKQGNTLYGTLWSHNEPYLFRSVDNGLTWELWKNFAEIFPDFAVPYTTGDDRNKLRHLHDIAIYDNAIFLGVGDAWRPTLLSIDSGETWKKIWDDGFTSHVLDEARGIVILGGDMEHDRGIAVYPLDQLTASSTAEATLVWKPEDEGSLWQGYTFGMRKIGDTYYASVHTETLRGQATQRYGILESVDGYQWNIFAEFETSEDVSQLYIASDGTHIYTSHNGGLFVVNPNLES